MPLGPGGWCIGPPNVWSKTSGNSRSKYYFEQFIPIHKKYMFADVWGLNIYKQ